MILSKLAWRKGDKTSICKIWIRTTTFFQHITSYSSNKTSKEKKSLGHYYPKPFGPDYWKVLRTDEITKEFFVRNSRFASGNFCKLENVLFLFLLKSLSWPLWLLCQQSYRIYIRKIICATDCQWNIGEWLLLKKQTQITLLY